MNTWLAAGLALIAFFEFIALFGTALNNRLGAGQKSWLIFCLMLFMVIQVLSAVALLS